MSWALTYAFVLVGWVFFRAQSFADSFTILGKMFNLNGRGISWLYPQVFAIIGLMALGYAYAKIRKLDDYYLTDLKTFKGAFILIFIILTFYFFGVVEANPFIYFQF